eukprot:TRINITY_DN60875_c0_g1_i1.p1 TRINITY_DN60875_c0_g1~~TRINITY_DN60875_c0_g1_i1.p1  ORF type:complete len:525 (+),score=86.96 TRINITY_DN60875_c0_g1_i1:172-1746(+)
MASGCRLALRVAAAASSGGTAVVASGASNVPSPEAHRCRRKLSTAGVQENIDSAGFWESRKPAGVLRVVRSPRRAQLGRRPSFAHCEVDVDRRRWRVDFGTESSASFSSQTAGVTRTSSGAKAADTAAQPVETIAASEMPAAPGEAAALATQMTLSSFLRLLADVDAERAAKGSAGLMRLRAPPLPRGLPRVPLSEVERLNRFGTIAVAAYGPATLDVLRSPPTSASFSPPQQLCKNDVVLNAVKAHLPDGVDLLHAKTSSTWLRPAYFVAVDHERQCVVLSIRGTMSPEDLLTDLSAEEASTPWGPGHAGMFVAAQSIVREVQPILEETLERYELGHLVVVGHSLGASVASYVSLLLGDAREPHGVPVDISCYAYGSPGVFPAAQAASVAGRNGSDDVHICTVVNGRDWISRLSYGHVVCLLERGHQEWDSMVGVVEGLMAGPDAKAEQAKPQTPPSALPEKLYPCGRLIFLLPDEGAVYGSQEHLSELHLHPTMFMEHLPIPYENALLAAVEISRRDAKGAA